MLSISTNIRLLLFNHVCIFGGFVNMKLLVKRIVFVCNKYMYVLLLD